MCSLIRKARNGFEHYQQISQDSSWDIEAQFKTGLDCGKATKYSTDCSSHVSSGSGSLARMWNVEPRSDAGCEGASGGMQGLSEVQMSTHVKGATESCVFEPLFQDCHGKGGWVYASGGSEGLERTCGVVDSGSRGLPFSLRSDDVGIGRQDAAEISRSECGAS